VRQEQEQRDHQYLPLDLMCILERKHLLLLELYPLDHHLVRLDQLRLGKRKRPWVRLIKLVSLIRGIEWGWADCRRE